MDGPLCSENVVMGWMPWALVVFYLLIFAVFLVMRTVFGDRRRKQHSAIGLIGGFVVACGLLLFIRSKDYRGFQEFHQDASTLTFSYFLPKGKDTLALAAVDSVSVVRGRHFYKGKRSDDRAWLQVKGPQGTYDSCETAKIESLAAAGRSLAKAAGKPVVWQERCPDPGNQLVPTTEAEVTAAGRMEIPATCASARP